MNIRICIGLGFLFPIAAIVACSSTTTSGGPVVAASDAATGADGTTTYQDSGKDVGTGQDSGNDGQQSSDSASDTGSTACADYCACMALRCAGTSPGGSGCLAACAAQSTWDLSCRTSHCGYSPAPPSAPDTGYHCTHAAGVSICQ